MNLLKISKIFLEYEFGIYKADNLVNHSCIYKKFGDFWAYSNITS